MATEQMVDEMMEDGRSFMVASAMADAQRERALQNLDGTWPRLPTVEKAVRHYEHDEISRGKLLGLVRIAVGLGRDPHLQGLPEEPPGEVTPLDLNEFLAGDGEGGDE